MTPEVILDFWLHDVGPKGWYEKNPALDRRIRDLFGATWENAAQITEEWRDTPRGTLAAIILTDQFPRNMFRGDARSYATDALACELARHALTNGYDLQIDPPARQFFYLPFEHSEQLGDQHLCVELFAKRMPGENLLHAEMHRDVIAHFGRFPWRNGDLDRESSPAEQALIEAGGYGALVSGKQSLADLD